MEQFLGLPEVLETDYEDENHAVLLSLALQERPIRDRAPDPGAGSGIALHSLARGKVSGSQLKFCALFCAPSVESSSTTQII